MKPLPSEDLELVLERTRTLWEQARSKRMFISGGTGFFGAWLLETLNYCNRKLRLDLSVTVLTRDPDAFLSRMPHLAGTPSIHLLQGDVRSFTYPDGDFDFVIHGATSTSPDASSRPAELLSTLIHGTERMIGLAKQRKTRNLLYASSGAVYGRQPASLSCTPEDYFGGPDFLDPSSVYGEGKRVSELMCSLFARETGVRVAMARCFTLVGPHLPLDQHFAIGNFIRDALSGKDLSVRGDGSPIRSYLYAADLTIWLWTLLLGAQNLPTNPYALNVGSAEEISIADLAGLVVKTLNPALRVEIESSMKTAERQPRYVPDVRKAKSDLGLAPIISLQEAIRRTADWYR